MRREDFASGKGKDELQGWIKSQIEELGNPDARKVLFVQVKPFEGEKSVQSEVLESISQIAMKQIESIGMEGKVAVMVAPHNISMQFIDLGEKNG